MTIFLRNGAWSDRLQVEELARVLVDQECDSNAGKQHRQKVKQIVLENAQKFYPTNNQPQKMLMSVTGHSLVAATTHHFVTQLEHYCNLQVDKAPHSIKKTGVICTIGPASRTVPILRDMIKAGMTIARLNFSHGTHEYHEESIKIIREAASAFPTLYLAIALDTKGPEVRTGMLEDKEAKDVMLMTGSEITVTTNDDFKEKCTATLVYLDFHHLPKLAKPGQNIFIDDGLIHLRVKEIDGDNMKSEVVIGGPLSGRKGVNLTGIEIDLPSVSEQDVNDLKFAVKHEMDMIFASFVRDAENVKHIKDAMGEEGKHIQVIAKIENHQGLKNIDAILEVADGVMVARGDLGTQIPQEKLTIAQKMLISKTNRVGKPVICATQMMESMTTKPRPTRAEISDVTNAVLDGADCVMLSGESAKGIFAVDTVRTMSEICLEAEKIFFQRKFFTEMRLCVVLPTSPTHATAISAVELSIQTGAQAIIVLSTTGLASRLLAKYKPPAPIIAVIADIKLARLMRLSRGVIPVVVSEETADWVADTDKKVQIGLKTAMKMGFVKQCDPVIIVTGWRQGQCYSNTIRIIAAPAEDALSVTLPV